LVPHIKGRTQIEDVSEHGAKENISMYEGGCKKGMEKTA
jgi:hypothetical protein